MFISIDIGCTTTRIATFKNLQIKSLIYIIKYSTPQNYNLALNEIVKTIRELLKEETLEGIGISLCEVVDSNGYIPVIPDNIHQWVHKNLVEDLKKYFYVDIKIRIDSECGAIAESIYISKTSVKRLYLLIVGTGTGGTFIDRSVNPMYILSNEVGHMIIDKDDIESQSKTRGSFASFISGNRIK